MAKILLLGAGSSLGSAILAGLYEEYDVVPYVSRANAKLFDTVKLRQVDNYLNINNSEIKSSDLVIYCGGIGDVGFCQKNIKLSRVENVEKPLALGRIAGDFNVPYVHFSSAAVFGSPSGIIDLNTPLEPVSTYGEHKAEVEERLAAECSTLINIRLFSTYSKYQKKMFIYDFMRKVNQLKTGESKVVKLMGDGSSVRDFIHVDSLVFLMKNILMNSNSYLGSHCFASGMSYSVMDVVKYMAGFCSFDVQVDVEFDNLSRTEVPDKWYCGENISSAIRLDDYRKFGFPYGIQDMYRSLFY